MLLHKKEFFGNGFFTADHVTVCGLLVLFLCYFGLYIRTHVETVVLLSQQNPDDRIRVKVDLDALDETSAEAKATYKKITDWVQEHYGFHVTNLNIAQVKRKNGIIERDNYNKPKSEDSRQLETTPEKERAITEALKHFKMIKRLTSI